MRYCLGLFYCLLFISQLHAQSVVTIKGTIKNATSKNIDAYYSNSWLDPLETRRTCNIEEQGNFSLPLRYEEKVKFVYLVYANDTVELVLTGSDLLVTANAHDLLKTMAFEGATATDANFCLKHTQEKGMLNKYVQKISAHFNSTPAAFEKIAEADYKDEMTYFIKHASGISAAFVNFWKVAVEYNKYDAVVRFISQQAAHKKGSEKAYLPAFFKDDYMEVPQYRDYVKDYASQMYGRYMKLYPESRDAAIKKMYTVTLPPKTAEYAAATIAFSLKTKTQLDEFIHYFPQSRYTALIQYHVKQQ